MNTTGLILLAAGGSTRMGQPKQLLSYKDKTLLQHSIDIAAATDVAASVIVYGAYESDIKKQLATHSLISVTNPEWEDGIATSIGCGLSTLLMHAPDITQVVFMVADQPFITTALLNDIIQLASAKKYGITASCYDNIAGTPVLFDQKYFALLLLLMGDEGAKKVIKSHMHDVQCIEFPMGLKDIDTPQEYNELTGNNMIS